MIGDLTRIVLGSSAAKVRAYIRLLDWCRTASHPYWARFIANRLQGYGLYVSPHARISRTVKFPHPTAIVIGEGVVIEDGVRIFQSVTLGGARIGDWQAGRYPVIGKGTTIFAGAVIVGDIRIGENCVIGANSVVLSDIPDNSTCVGAPARVVGPPRQTEGSPS